MRFRLTELLEVYKGSMIPLGRGVKMDVPDSALSVAWLVDIEGYYTRMTAQLNAYGQLIRSRSDPIWTAVTGYYGAFLAATTLLSMIGETRRRLENQIGLVNRGFHVFTTQASAYPGHNTLVVTPQRQDSHKTVWSSLVHMCQNLVTVDPSDSYTNRILASFVRLVQRPILLSEFRNRVNYSVDEDPMAAQLWRCTFMDLTQRGLVEQEIAASNGLRDEQRSELVALGCASLVSALYRDYVARADRPDSRPSGRRARSLRSEISDAIQNALDVHLL